MGIQLGLKSVELEHMQENHRGNVKRIIFEMLRCWRDRCKLRNESIPNMRRNLAQAFKKENRNDLAEKVK